ncbi:hypothetical protein [Pseudolysinimonas sp.]
MAVIVDAKKRFESARIVACSYANYDDPADSGVFLVDLEDVDAWQVFPPDAFRRTAELPLLKAFREFQATGSRPTR